MKTYLLLGAACVSMAAAPALAQTTSSTTVDHPDGSTTTTTEVQKNRGGTTGGAVGGAIAGAVVAGPIGAVVGGIAGATVGHTLAPPSEVKTYVTTQTPPTPSAYSGPVTVGKPIDGDIAWQEVPKYPKYSWAYMGNGQRVVIDNANHNVVAVY